MQPAKVTRAVGMTLVLAGQISSPPHDEGDEVSHSDAMTTAVWQVVWEQSQLRCRQIRLAFPTLNTAARDIAMTISAVDHALQQAPGDVDNNTDVAKLHKPAVLGRAHF